MALANIIETEKNKTIFGDRYKHGVSAGNGKMKCKQFLAKAIDFHTVSRSVY